jgi:hypothetical protein
VSESNGFAVSPFLDGYDLEHTIPAVPGRWPEVRIRYRPLSADDESRIFALKSLTPTEPIVKFYAEAFAGNAKDGIPAKLLGWDLKDRTGKPVPHTAANLRQLTPQFFDTLKAVIDGSIPTESGETQAEADVKNS